MKQINFIAISKRFKSVICAFFLFYTFGVWDARGETLVLTFNGSTNAYSLVTTSSSSENTFTQGTTTLGYKSCKDASYSSVHYIQFDKGAGVLYNKTALPGSITKIKVEYRNGTSEKSDLGVKCGTSKIDTRQTSSLNATLDTKSNGADSCSLDAANKYTFFNLSVQGGTSSSYGNIQVIRITITYSSASCGTIPTVTAASNSSVNLTTATVSCSSGISSLGSAGCSISSYGFVIGESANPSIGGSGVTQHEVGTTYTSAGESFSKNLTGLSPETTYYVRAYATNGKGTAYGTQTSFTTLSRGCSDHGASSITTGSSTSRTTGPLEEYYNYSTRQILYSKTDLGLPSGKKGTIKSISFKYAGSSAMSKKTSVDIYLANTALTTLSTSSVVPFSSFTKVYSGSLNCAAAGWHEFLFNVANFEYNGIGSLAVMIDDNSGAYDGQTYTFYINSATGSQIHKSDDYTNENPSTINWSSGATVANERPHAQFCILEADMMPATVTLMDNSATLTEASAGAGVNLPSRTGCSGYTFAGWTKSWVAAQTSWTTTAPTIIDAGTYYPTTDENLYPVYTKTEGGGSGFKLSLNSGGTDYYIGAKGSGAYMSAVTDAASAVVFTFATGYLSFDDSGTTTYISSAGDNTTLTVGTSTPSSTWTETGTSTVTYQSSATGSRYLGFNSSASPVRFAPYGNSYAHEFTKHSLSTTSYISVPDCCTDPELGYATASVTKTYGDAAFTNTLTNSHNVAVTYSSSDTDVATVASDGTVTIKKAGTTTITASSIAQTVSTVDYCADEASYTLTVNKADISPTLTYSPNSVAVDENSATPTVGGNSGSGGVTYAITSATPSGCATINTSTGVVTGVAVGSVTVTATVAATDNYNGNTATATVTITAATNFPNNKTIFIWAHNTSAWHSDACVKAWFHSYGGSETAQPTYWLFDASGGGDDGKKLFAAIVPASGNLPYLDINRFASDCTTPWNKNGGVSYSDASGSNAIRSEGYGTDQVYWNANAVTLNLHGDPSNDDWATSLASFSDQGNGVWAATYNNYAPANAAGESQDFKIKTNYSGWIGNTGSNYNATLDGMHVGSTYNITATLDIKDHSLVMSKTFVKGTIHFDMQGHGSAISDLTNVTAGSKISAPSPAPTASGWHFIGWYKEPACTNAWNFASDVVNETMTLYAKWVQTFTVTYNANGGSGSMTDINSPYDDGATVTVLSNSFTAPTGKEFNHWDTKTGDDGTDYAPSATFTISANTTLYAQWSNVDYNVTYSAPSNGNYTIKVADGSATSATKAANYGQTITIAATPNSSYRFGSWTIKKTSDNSDVTGSVSLSSSTSANATFTMPAYGVTVIATFVQTHTVSWKSNGADYVSPVTYDHGGTLALPAGTPTAPAGCSSKVFVGWTSDPEITSETSTRPTIISAGGAVNADATYRAVFADQVGDPEHFKRVTQLSDITEGGEIVFGFYVTSNTKLCGLDFSGWTTYSCATGVDETSNKIPVPSDANIWTVSKESGYWVFTNKGDGTTKLATSSSSSNNELDPETQTYYKWNIGASSSGTNNFYVQLYNGSSLTTCALELFSSVWKIYSPTGSTDYSSNAYTALKLYVPAGSEDNYITLCSTCTTPSDVAASGITTDGATITWNGTSQENNGGSGTGFVVKYGTNSTRDANSNTINVAAGTNTADLTGLAQGTKYYVWVQSKCDNSWSTTPAEFTTLVSHTATFIGADGSTLQSSAIVEGESVTYSGSTPVSCDTGDGASTTFVGWATDTWEGKVAKGSIPVGTTFYDVVGGGESLPNMGNSDVTYYAVFAKATGDPLEENTYTGSFSSKVFSSSNSTSATVSGVSWTLDAYHYDNEWNQVFCTDFSTGNNSRGQKVGSSSNWPAYMSLTTSGISGTITSVAVSTAGNSGVNATVAVSVGSSGWKLKNTNNYSASLTNSNTAYEFTGSGTGSISIDWAEEEENYTDALYFSQIVVAYTTGGDISYSNYMTTCSQCVTPNSVTADAITEAGATINWAGTSKTGTTGFTVLWGTDGTRANNSNSANVDADTKTYSITGLSAGTTYYVWVQSRCDGSWSDRISFTTKAIHTISFSADNGTISSGATIDIVNGETLTFPSVTSTTCGTFVGWTTGDYDNTAAPSPFYTAGAEMADITAPAAYKAVYRTASGAETLVTDNWTGAKTGVTTYATWTKTDASAATYQGYTAKNSSYSNCIQMKSADSNSGIITTASGGDAKKVTITWNSNTTSGRTVDVYGKKAAYSSAADLYSAGTQGTKIGSIVYGTSTELEIDGDYQYIGLRSNSSALYIDNIAIQWYGSPMHYMTSPTCNPMVGITESLSAFTYAYGAGPSASQSFTVSGSNLTNNVTVAAPANYEVCLTAAGTYSSSVSIPQVAGEIDNTTVYIRLKEGLNVGSYNGGVITVSSTGANDATSAALTGSVTKGAGAIAFTDFNAGDHYEAELNGANVTINYNYTKTGDGTLTTTRVGGAYGTLDTENKTWTLTAAGTYSLRLTLGDGTNYSGAGPVVAEFRVKCVDTYVDFIHNKAVLTYGSGTPVTDGKMEDWGSGYTVPYVADESEATSGSCQTTHFKFVGWVSEDEINIVEGTFKPGYTLISAGTAEKTASTKTYYAVWAKLED